MHLAHSIYSTNACLLTLFVYLLSPLTTLPLSSSYFLFFGLNDTVTVNIGLFQPFECKLQGIDYLPSYLQVAHTLQMKDTWTYL